MSWEDFVPVIGPAYEAAKGNWGAAAGDALIPGGGAVYTAYKGAVNEQKQGDLTAAAQAQQLGANLNAQDMQGLSKAENYFAPAQKAITAAYGAPGAMTGGPSQYPVAPAPARGPVGYYGK
jgi:hypothetical protein